MAGESDVELARDVEGGVRLVIAAKPGSARQGVSLRDGVVVVKVSASAEDGKANAAIQDVVAAFFGVPRSRVEIVRGDTGRHKALLLRGLTAAIVDERLATLR